MFTRTESFGEFVRFYPVITLILLIHLLLYVLALIPVLPGGLLMQTFAGVNIYIAEGQYWRLVTPIFLHGGFSHLLFNSFSLVLFGPALERMLGKGRFILLYLLTGIAANIATFILKPMTYVHVGSSGAIFGLFGFYMAIIVYRRHALSQQNKQIILTLSVIGLIMTFIQPNINVTAHIFGLIAGFLFGAAMFSKGKQPAYGSGSGSFSAKGYRPSLRNIGLGKLLLWGGIALLAILGLLGR